MMSDVTSARLAAWIRFIPDKDGYGVPLFSAGGNHLLMPKTDNRLRISAFVKFYNEDKFPISYEIPTEAQQVYKIDDKIPIPFTIEGRCDIIDPGIGFDELDNILGPKSKTMAATLLRDVLRDAHANLLSSVFVGRQKELRDLIEIWNRVRDQRGSYECVVVTGQPGIGKTTLIDRFRQVVAGDKTYAPPFIEVQSRQYALDLVTSNDKFAYEGSSTDIKFDVSPVIIYIPMDRLFGNAGLFAMLMADIQLKGGMLIVETRDQSSLDFGALPFNATFLTLGTLTHVEIDEFLREVPFKGERALWAFNASVEIFRATGGSPLALRKIAEEAMHYTL